MRINQFVARATGISRRKADAAVEQGKVTVNGVTSPVGYDVANNDVIEFNGQIITLPSSTTTIILNKPVGYVCSRSGQGSNTIYDLLPAELHNLKPVGRLDKDSSGLLLLTNDGELANQLTHPKFAKQKVYEIVLDKDLIPTDQHAIENGIELEDGPSKLQLDGSGKKWTVTMSEGRNRQIRRTFGQLGYTVTKLHRTQFGPYSISTLRTDQRYQSI